MIVGVTGHQTLGTKGNVAGICDLMTRIILNIHTSYGYTCLAIGADQLFARLLYENNIPYSVIIPCRGYHKFYKAKKDKKQFEYLLEKSALTIKLSFPKPTEESFYQAGKIVVDNSDLLLSIWNELPAKGLGGTADIVKYAKLTGKEIININPVTLNYSKI